MRLVPELHFTIPTATQQKDVLFCPTCQGGAKPKMKVEVDFGE